MNDFVKEYFAALEKEYKSGEAREHAYRPALKSLIENLFPQVLAQNDPARQKVGAPDFILTRNNIPIGFIETKDINVGLDEVEKSDQMKRYYPLGNLVLTNYLEFRFYTNGLKYQNITIAEIVNHRLIFNEGSFEELTLSLKNFTEKKEQTVGSAEKLAKLMADKARLVREIIFRAIETDEAKISDLYKQFESFKTVLIHDLTPEQFSDIYAQTIAYGFFAARYHDQSLENFSRQEAVFLLPKSNPFLKKFFNEIAIDLDSRVTWVVDSLADLFNHANVKELMMRSEKETVRQNPIIHFYETFLGEYDPKLRKSRGVYYTPEPVVKFIVRAVDDILKTEFNLPLGLADTSKVEREVMVQGKKGRKLFHKVQILDPATGTGTFLDEVIKYVHSKNFGNQKGSWSSYVDNDLLPRLHGFELLMASYAMCHLKLDLTLTETGYKPTDKAKRIGVYLTNSLEEPSVDNGSLFSSWLSQEAQEADSVKKDTPVMVVMGNPPYSGESANKGEWIMSLMEDYKKEPGGKEKLKERNPKWVNDDYVKFLRFGQYFIEKNGEGILAFINPHGFLDNPTFRGMRWNLLKTYDKIYALDLHGNSKKKETAPDGGKDENVFDIQQGVSINLFVKTGKKNANELGKVFHYDLYGKRAEKYEFLLKNSLKSISYKELENVASNYFFVRKDFELQTTYDNEVSIADLFNANSVGVVTANDAVLINDDEQNLTKNIERFYKIEPNRNFIKKISYRPFDERFIYYDTKLVERPREKVMQHFLKGKNIGLIFRRQSPESNDLYIFISNNIIGDGYIRSDNKGGESIAPLYLYKDSNNNFLNSELERTPNLNQEILKQIEGKIGLKLGVSSFDSAQDDTQEQSDIAVDTGTFTPENLLDYIYAILHNPTYRERYKEFLKIDFPRVPFTSNKELFWKLVQKGKELRELHLLESPLLNNFQTKFDIEGNNEVTKVSFEEENIGELLSEKIEAYKKGVVGKVFINAEQYFDNVPEIAWNFYIGGYQPAQKWLKDRKARVLSFEDIQHYQKIIIALTQTDRVMKEIDELVTEWPIK